mmetsp:Transcript_115738/g.180864  ORF Transcript_115738/g.180864 Transcript_115738/m.180864 type:complete len:129 (-) Transcript_115738:128-514(-)
MNKAIDVEKTVEKATVHTTKTKNQTDASAVETISRLAKVKSHACKSKVVLSLSAIACVVAVVALVVMREPYFSSSGIKEILFGVAPLFTKKTLQWLLTLVACFAVAPIFLFRKSFAKKLLFPFAKKQA